MSDMTAARRNMVESQVRTNQVTDPRLLDAMFDLPRELFVPASLRGLAYMDQTIALGQSDTAYPQRAIMAPMPLARLVQRARVSERDLVLDIGCATGYSTSLLARLAGSVVALESDDRLAEAASRILVDLETDNAVVVTGELAKGYPDEGPYDVILLNGSVPEVPPALLDQLKDHGRLVAFVESEGMPRACLYLRTGSEVSARPLFEADVPRLPGFEVEAGFVF